MKRYDLLLVLILLTTNNYLFAQNSKKIKLEDDFYVYANSEWLDSVKIPQNETSVGTFETINKVTNKRLITILEDLSKNKKLKANSNEKKLFDFYSIGLDTIVLESKGLEPLLKQFGKIDDIKSKEEFINYIALSYKNGQGYFFGFDVVQDEKHSKVNTVFLEQTSLTLSSPQVYNDNSDFFKNIRLAYLKYLNTIFYLTNSDLNKSNIAANQVLDFDTEIAKAYLSLQDRYNVDLTYNKMTIEELEKLTPNLKWSKIFKLMGFSTSSVVVQNPKYLSMLNTMITSKSLEAWKNKLKALVIIRHNFALNFKFRDAFDELNASFSGVKKHNDRPEVMLYKCDNEILGDLYSKKYFSKDSKRKVEELAENIRETFKERLQNNEWMSNATKQIAVKKLNSIGFKIGFPYKLKNYAGLKINSESFYESQDAWSKFDYFEKIQKINKEFDKSIWATTAHTVNAFYDPSNNELTFPTAILQEPIFDKNYNEALLYGALGYVIAHEMTHGFDNNGNKYDEYGNANKWFLDKDQKEFDKLALKLENQYNNYKITDTISVNGKQTLAENIADLGGLSIAYYAYKKTKLGKMNDVEADKQFFISFARVWREKRTEQSAQIAALNDTHAPSRFRVNGVLSNFTPFYEVFGIKEGNLIYKRKEDRIEIW
jgi:putative endopeptidase